MKHFVYQLLIQMGTDLFGGYGETKDPVATEKDYRERLPVAGFTVVCFTSYECASEAQALEIEKHIQNNTLPVDLKVDRLRTECARGEQYGYITKLITDKLYQGTNSKVAQVKEEPHYRDSLNPSKKQTLKRNIAKWEALLEHNWKIPSIKGATYREEAKSCLECSLENLHANGEETEIYFPFEAIVGLECKVPIYKGGGYFPLSLDYLRRDLQKEIDKVNEKREQAKAERARIKRNEWYLALPEEDKDIFLKYFILDKKDCAFVLDNEGYSLADYKDGLQMSKAYDLLIKETDPSILRAIYWRPAWSLEEAKKKIDYEYTLRAKQEQEKFLQAERKKEAQELAELERKKKIEEEKQDALNIIEKLKNKTFSDPVFHDKICDITIESLMSNTPREIKKWVEDMTRSHNNGIEYSFKFIDDHFYKVMPEEHKKKIMWLLKNDIPFNKLAQQARAKKAGLFPPKEHNVLEKALKEHFAKT